MNINSLTMALVVGVLIICTVDGQLLNNGRSSSFKHLTGVQSTSTQLPRTPIAAKITAKVASNIGADSMQYRHYKRPHEDDADDDDQYRDRDYDSSSSSDARKLPTGVSGPVHTYIKTDKNANFKWGVRHFAGRRYRG
ncbi:uncharacterized protein LOC120415767 [Culex pipiens pallens]|uniref:uncharacterized protein LOC120415767 n=1 Tax=Culex pipiens pallens TaxID=42434 RepID=UPI001952C9E1|nr:uncharacterized protein LOC120415767 [Culex pipiens pallens]